MKRIYENDVISKGLYWCGLILVMIIIIFVVGKYIFVVNKYIMIEWGLFRLEFIMIGFLNDLIVF